jgi:hypothetical protein
MADATMNNVARNDNASGACALASLLLIACAVLTGCKEKTSKPETLDAKIAGETFKLELALTSNERFRGLSDRRSIPADGGMLFAFRQPRELGFVMRKCYVPIDIIYLGPRGHIVSMHRMKVQPYDTPEGELKSYPSGWPAQFAIELPGGTLDKLELKTGEQIELPYESLKNRAE